MGPEEMKKIGQWIGQVVKNIDNKSVHAEIRGQVKELCQQFPIYA